MIYKNKMPIRGVFELREISKETGEVLYSYCDENVITELGINTMFLRAVMDDPSETMKLSNFFLGIDTGAEEDSAGGWTVFNPRPAQKSFTSLNQFSVYEVPESDMVIDFPDQNKLQAGTLLDGEFILNTFFPDDVDLRYTSATFRYVNDTTFSYKRFPVRSLSRLIDVQIVWTFEFENADDYVCPIPDFESTLYAYYLNGSNLFRSTESLSTSDTALNASDYSVLPSGELFTLNSTTVKTFNQNLVETDSFSVVSSSMIDVHPNRTVIVAGGSRVASYVGGSQNWSTTTSGTVTEIRIIDQNRLLVAMGDLVWILSMMSGGILYTSEFTSNTIVSSSQDGEIFIGLKASDNAIIECAFDLSEISRNSLSTAPTSVESHHDNDMLYSNGNLVIKTNADLDFLWSRDIGQPVLDISVDRERNIYVITSNTLYKLNQDGSINSSTSISSPTKLIAVGSRWGMVD